MKKMNIIWILLLAAGFSACSDWFDISPKTEVKSKSLFTSESGFKSALVGIYGMMTRDDLYGCNLSFLFLEHLAQRYDNNPEATAESRGKIYDYENQTSSKTTLSSIWNSMYNNIANINNLLYNLEVNGTYITTPGYYELIKGEALALRAFHYFDLLRMWGPIYQQDPTADAVPYRDRFNAEKIPPMKADELLLKIIADLKEAEILLQNDLLEYRNNPIEPFLGYRSHRMNKYAAKALLARAYLYQGGATGKMNAAEKAKEVIDSCRLALVRNNREDRTMFDETLFGLNMFNMEKRVSTYFTTNVGQNGSELWISLGNAESLFEKFTCGINDIRYKNGYGFIHNDTKLMCRKYLKGTSNVYDEKIPLIRLSEMYYILAEALPLGTEANYYCNTVRNARGISRKDDVDFITEENRIEVLTKEYAKEFFAEGQLFYFLKRNARTDFYRCPFEKGMKLSYYVFRIPDDEVEFGMVSR